MIPPRPEAGLVLRYSFLWRHEADQGREEAAKDRPVVVLVLLAEGEEVIVAPITTVAPGRNAPAIEVPSRVRAHLGLDAERCWITVATLNHFVWPGPDLRAIPGRTPATSVYGFIPQRLLQATRAIAMAELSKRVPGLVVRRSQ
ncbi:MAG: hypothetical protein L6R19_05490 [Alphaproteobacteria bacterium]|nr:hypothetical protein [Alphaproteobacteria bacterium]